MLALLTCDAVAMGMPPFQKPSVLGIYDRIFASVVPAAHLLTVFASLMDVLEPVKLSARLTRPSDSPGATGQKIGEVEVPTPQSAGETSHAFFTTQVMLQEFGRYEIHVYGNDAYLAHKPLFVTQALTQPPPQPPV